MGLFRRLRNQAVEKYQRHILAFLEPSGKTIDLLDCGCDDGEWTVALGERIGNVSLYGLEVNWARSEMARLRGIRIVAADLNRAFPFADDSYDVIHANQVIEHLADTDNFVREMRRVLRPHGYAVICTENLAGWHNIFALVMGWQPFSLTNVCDTRFQIGNPLAIHSEEAAVNPRSWQHLRVFAYQGLRELFTEHGFTVERYVGAGYYPLPGRISRLDPRHAAFLTIKVRKPL